MLRHNDPGHSIDELVAYNRSCIEELSAGFTTLWLEDHMQVGATDALESLTTLSYPFPPVKTRLEQLEEAVQIIRAMWTAQPATFEGRHYSIHDAYCAPQPSPAIPILIGGGGERRTLAIVARYADWWNFNSVPVEEYARKLAILKQHCERIGRDFSTIKLTYLCTLSVSEDPAQVKRDPSRHFIAGNAAEVIRELERFAEVGVTHCMFRIPNLETLHNFVNNVAPHFA